MTDGIRRSLWGARAVLTALTLPAAAAADLTPQDKALVAAGMEEGAVTIPNPLSTDRSGQLLG